MRDINRIDEFLDVLKDKWKKYPDLRFGQFCYGFFSSVSSSTKKDIFYIEDDEMIEYLRKYLD